MLAYDLHQITASAFNRLQASMPAVLITGATVTLNSPFFPSSGQSHSQHSFLPTRGGTVQAESTWVPCSVLRCFTHPKTITHPGTNRAGHAITMLIKSKHYHYATPANISIKQAKTCVPLTRLNSTQPPAASILLVSSSLLGL